MQNQLNRVSKFCNRLKNMSQSHLNAEDEQKEVELKAMGENSQMFQDSII